MKSVSRLVVMILIILALAACSSSESSPTTVPTQAPTSEVEPSPSPDMQPAEMPEATAGMEDMASESETMRVDRPAWQQVELVDARSGETFTLADFAGKTVYVEPMATWCTNCRAQLHSVVRVVEELGEEDFVFVGLSVETNLSAADLASYTEREGFAWRFAVLSDDALRMLVEQFGRAVGNPPSTPHFIIRPDGTFTNLYTGQETSGELIEQLRAARGA